LLQLLLFKLFVLELFYCVFLFLEPVCVLVVYAAVLAAAIKTTSLFWIEFIVDISLAFD
jgi:hypothetical protein